MQRVILVVTVTVIATELFIVTDIGPFRFSIGTVVFVYAVLSLHHLLIIPTAGAGNFYPEQPGHSYVRLIVASKGPILRISVYDNGEPRAMRPLSTV
ncbi:MAG: hypothetical protein AB1767_02210 [Bacillota bacterium]